MDLDRMTPREVVAGLMRGNREEQKLGYSAEAAVAMAATVKDLDHNVLVELVAYAEGFADGLPEDPARAMPNISQRPITGDEILSEIHGA